MGVRGRCCEVCGGVMIVEGVGVVVMGGAATTAAAPVAIGNCVIVGIVRGDSVGVAMGGARGGARCWMGGCCIGCSSTLHVGVVGIAVD